MAPAVRCAWADWPVTSGDGVALSNESTAQWQERVSCSSAFLSATKRRRYRGSGRGLDALVVIARLDDGRGIFEDSGVMRAARYVTTSEDAPDLSVLRTRGDGRARDGCT